MIAAIAFKGQIGLNYIERLRMVFDATLGVIDLERIEDTAQIDE